MAITPKNDTDINVDKISEKSAAAGISLDDQVICDEEIQHKDQSAPGNPADGVSVFSEGGILKALTAAGITTQLGLLPVKFTGVVGGAVSNATMNFAIAKSESITVESDELILAIGSVRLSHGLAGGQVELQTTIGGVGSTRAVFTSQAADTGGARGSRSVFNAQSGFSGAIDVAISFRSTGAGTSFIGEARLHIFQFKLRS